MATSKTGGSRAYLRGRVGSDVYSIGKTANGKKQQVVRSLAESVSNPQTKAQMRGRLIMSTVMQAVSAMRPIIDHSFDNVLSGMPCLAEFEKRNYALISADIAAHPASDNVFGLNKYHEKGVKFGAYQISNGSALDVNGIVIAGANKTLTIALGNNKTIADLLAVLGLGANDYFTACSIVDDGNFIYERFHITQALAQTEVISAENIADIFSVEGNTSVAVTFSNGNIVLTLGDFSANAGIIVSRKVASGYQHNKVVLEAVSDPQFTYNVAIETYPIGQQKFLNGGGEESEATPFEPEPFETAIESVTIDGAAWSKGSKVTKQAGTSANVSVTLTNYEAGHNIYFGASQYDTQCKLSAKTASGSIENDELGTETYGLYVDGTLVESWGDVQWDND